MYKFSHVDAFYQVARYVKKVNKDPECPEEYKIYEPVDFRGTVKLHGTNSGITHKNGQLIAQSRTRVITPEVDNHGFAKFTQDNQDIVLEIMNRIRGRHQIGESKSLTLYGEWIGPGLQKGVAINELPEKQWVIFAVKVSNGEEQNYIDAVPMLGDEFQDQNIFSIYDVPTWALSVDFTDPVSKEKAIAKFEELTELVEKECPWAKRFGISGIGEGIVWVPVGDYWGKSNLFFKTKGSKHKEVNSKKKKEAMDPEMLASIEEFANFAITENRLNKGLDAIQEAGHNLEPKSTGHFLKWVGQDIKRECRLELEDNNLEWKQVSKIVNERARNFYLKKMKEECL